MIVSRLDYLNKMKQLISDNTKFKQLKQNPTKSREESLHISANLEMRKLLMMQHFTRFYPVDRLLVFCVAFQRFIKPVARSALLFHLLTPTTTILLPTLSAYFSQFRPTNTLLRTPLGLRTGPKSTNITTE